MLSSDLRPFKSYETKKNPKKTHSLLERVETLDSQNAVSFSKDRYDRVALVVRRLFLTCS